MVTNIVNDSAIAEIAATTMDEPIEENKEKSFYFDGVYCLSYEWFIKSLNVKTIAKQKRICSGDHGAVMLKETLSHNTVFWHVNRYRIYSKSYEDLIKRAEEAANGEN